MRDQYGPVIGVLGGSGGVGSTTFAAVVAAVTGGMLIDVDPLGGGVDVLLGIEETPGARWSGLQLDGGYLDPELLLTGLPRWGAVAVLAADAVAPTAAAISQVVEAAASCGVVVLDLPRGASDERDEALRLCGLAVVVAAAQVRPLAAAHAVVSSMPEVPIGLVLRRGPVELAEAAEFVGIPLLGVLAAASRSLDPGRLPHAPARLARGIVDGLR